MTVLARDAVASDHLVYAWPFPIGPECEVSCAEDEQVVMCPAWMVGDRLGPGRHRWRTPDPSRPVGAFFVLTAPVEVSFDMVTSFVVPTTGMPVRLRASGSLQVRCSDPGLLIAQFVGLPFDHINDGVLRSVSRSVERMLARLLTRRAVMSGTPVAVTDPNMLPSIVEELIAYNPTAGAVFGVELIRMGYLIIVADDGMSPYLPLPSSNPAWPQPQHANGHHRSASPTTPQMPQSMPQPVQQPVPSGPQYKRPATPVLETIRGMAAVAPPEDEAPTELDTPTLGRFNPHAPPTQASGEIIARHSTVPPGVVSGEIGRGSSPVIAHQPGPPMSAVSGEIVPRSSTPAPAPAPQPGPPVSAVSGEIVPRSSTPAATPAPQPGPPVSAVSGEIVPRHKSTPPVAPVVEATPASVTPPPGPPVSAVSGEIKSRNAPTQPMAPLPKLTPPMGVSGELGAPKPAMAIPSIASRNKPTLPPPLPALPRKSPADAAPDDATRPDVQTLAAPAPAPAAAPAPKPAEARGSIMGIGMGAVGSTPVSGGVVGGEIAPKIAPGQRVLVPGPNGLMQSATVRQLLQGYYELEVGSSGQTIWVPVGGVVPEQA